ncbi:bifunctional diguanylate cyclase/phosphodiesterase [Psychrobacillus sp. OK032]|uniref:putative bifunctional diguanylate cyclase/phosphodiesterase n=1 Tax=Psychrobacillus sp. OK032 TaxID=1884358 RepID=UPI0008C2D41E|nr:EAL domain-containing protein [Psychrobacillus sp. OK032]SER69126.1 EAL domain, c-di-GMP-specific phosphodiesterase class I (or its enzymatically inactive variant) [Psychrobacillus sp. OK032]
MESKANLHQFNPSLFRHSSNIIHSHQLNKSFSLESSLPYAIEQNQLELYYQPKINAKTNQIIGAEALIRWNHPKWGIISPNEFIPLAEKTGLINEIGKWVKYTACAQNKTWQEAELPMIPISINLSASRFLERDLICNIIRTLKDTKLEPQYLEIEITETSLLENEEIVFSVLDELRDLGIKIALDDFGTGYSSLSYLNRFKGKIDILKIDRSFIRDLSSSHEEDSNFIVNMIIQLSHQLKMNVIAEGVETTEQLQVLQKYNCNTIQGYLFSKPLPAHKFAELLKTSLCENQD